MESLYQTQLLALAKFARDVPPLPFYTHQAVVNNPVCGDKVSAYLTLKDDVITDCTADVKGCALCEAGAGLWIQSVTGTSLLDLAKLHDGLADWLAGKTKEIGLETGMSPDSLGALTPVRDIKNRHQCVLLAFSTATAFTTASQDIKKP